MHTRLTIAPDRTVTVPIEFGDVGAEVDVTVARVSDPAVPAAGSQVNLPRELWLEKFLRLEGSVPGLTRPEQPVLDPIPEFD